LRSADSHGIDIDPLLSDREFIVNRVSAICGSRNLDRFVDPGLVVGISDQAHVSLERHDADIETLHDPDAGIVCSSAPVRTISNTGAT
jgi:hypothetical protein